MMSLSGIAVSVLLETAVDAPQSLYAWTRMYHYGHLALPKMGGRNLPVIPVRGVEDE